MKTLMMLAGLLAVFAGAARAEDAPRHWQVDYAHSKLGFVGEQNGARFEGGFRIFNALIAFDPDHPESGKIVVTIDIASAYAGSGDRDEMLPGKDWFDTSKFPQAQFASTAIRKTGPWKYEADGVLTIKGIAKPVTLPFTLAPSTDLGNGCWHATGRLPLMRNDFAVGLGQFSGEDYVRHAVDVVVDIEAK